MLVADLSCENLQYDVHAILNAFYEGENVIVLTPETGAKKREACAEPSIFITATETETRIVLKGEAAHQNVQFVWNYTTDEYASPQWKSDFKAFLYRSFSGVLGRQLPWGNLTGIRPTKIAMTMLEEGGTEEEILRFLKERHFVSDEKARLCVDIAKREKQILSGIHYKDGYSLYVGIPFCPTTCLYCSFTSYPIHSFRGQVERYLDCVEKEMKATSELMRDKILDSVYIGGGTPTTLSPEQLGRLIGNLKTYFDFDTVREFTVEAGRADSITREKLEVLYRHGVTRISVNPQTMKEETLRLIGRQHTTDQVKEAFAMAREIGFTNINMDLILGLPGETSEDVAETINQICLLAPDSLTVHSLALKRASKLGAWIEKNDISMLKNTDETMAIAQKGACAMNMKPYYLYRQKNMAGNFENVGYAREGKFGIYNILIMEEVQTIVALGAGSITKKVSGQLAKDGSESILIERCENVKDVALYIQKIDEMIERKRGLLEDA